MDVEITTRAQRPQFDSSIWDMPDSWPTFMDQDLIAGSLFGVVTAPYPELTVVATDPGGTVVAHGQATAFRLDMDGRRELPDTGWDQILVWANSDLRTAIEPDVCERPGDLRPSQLAGTRHVRPHPVRAPRSSQSQRI